MEGCDYKLKRYFDSLYLNPWNTEQSAQVVNSTFSFKFKSLKISINEKTRIGNLWFMEVFSGGSRGM